MPTPMIFRTVTNKERKVRTAKTLTAAEAIGTIEKDTDTFILTYGQFSLIDALTVILDQTGPADVAISTWTAADAHLQKTQEAIESAEITRFRMVVDRSFANRKPEYLYHMTRLFGADCIRFVRIHAKFMVVRSATHNIAVRTSMNLNENPRIENIEISESRAFCDFLTAVVDSIFSEVKPGEVRSQLPDMADVQELFPFQEVEARRIPRSSLNEPQASHTVKQQ